MEKITIEVKFTRDLSKVIDELNESVKGKGLCLDNISFKKTGILDGEISLELSQDGVNNFKTSKYTGVYWNKNRTKWMWQISHLGRRYNGVSDNEVECARQYDIKAIQLRGKKAVTNFKKENYTNETN